MCSASMLGGGIGNGLHSALTLASMGLLSYRLNTKCSARWCGRWQMYAHLAGVPMRNALRRRRAALWTSSTGRLLNADRGVAFATVPAVVMIRRHSSR